MTQYKPLRIWTGTEWIDVGHPGPQGASAYDIAVANGFVGTEVEWLASLQAEGLTPPASAVSVDPVSFSNILDSSATDVQTALEQLDANVAAAADGGFWATRPGVSFGATFPSAGYTTWATKGQQRFSPPIKLFAGETYGTYRIPIATQDAATTLRLALYNANAIGAPTSKIANTETTTAMDAAFKTVSLPTPFAVPATAYYIIAVAMEGGTAALDACYAVQQITVTQGGIPEVNRDFVWTTGAFANTAFAGPTNTEKGVAAAVYLNRTA